MKKIPMAVFLLLLFANFACVKKASDNEERIKKQNNKILTLKIANYAVLESGYIPFWEKIKSGFEQEHQNVKIEWISAPYGEIVNQVINMAGGGDRVDAIFGEISWVPSLQDSGLAAPVTDILSENFLKDFYPEVLASFNIDGKPYGVPLYISPFVLYYNKELFKQAGLDPDQPPQTYDEMLKYAEKLSKLKDPNGNKVYAFGQTTASVPISGSSLTAMIFNFGGQVLDSSGKLSVDNQGFTQAFEMLKLLDDKGYSPQNTKLKDLRNLFALGQLGMYYDQSWGFNGVKSINPTAMEYTASAAPLIGGTGSGQSLLQSHAFILVDNGKEHREALSQFVEYVISEKSLNDYLKNVTPAYPARRAMAEMEGVINNGILKGAANSSSNIKQQPFIPLLNDLNLELCTLAQAVTVGNSNVNAAIDNFKKKIAGKL